MSEKLSERIKRRWEGAPDRVRPRDRSHWACDHFDALLEECLPIVEEHEGWDELNQTALSDQKIEKIASEQPADVCVWRAVVNDRIFYNASTQCDNFIASGMVDANAHCRHCGKKVEVKP